MSITKLSSFGIANINDVNKMTDLVPIIMFDGIKYNNKNLKLADVQSGDYNNLSNLPTLFDGNYNKLSNLPTLFDGNYNKLSNLPNFFDGSLPTQFVSSDLACQQGYTYVIVADTLTINLSTMVGVGTSSHYGIFYIAKDFSLTGSAILYLATQNQGYRVIVNTTDLIKTGDINCVVTLPLNSYKLFKVTVCNGDSTYPSGGNEYVFIEALLECGTTANKIVQLDTTGRLPAVDGSNLTGISSGITSPLTTKGDIWGYSTIDTRRSIGANGQYLVADSAQSTGLTWSDLGVPYQVFESPKTSDYTIQQSDHGLWIPFTNTSSVTLTLPNGLISGTQAIIDRQGTGTISFSGTTIGKSNAIANQYGVATAIWNGTNWRLVGDL